MKKLNDVLMREISLILIGLLLVFMSGLIFISSLGRFPILFSIIILVTMIGYLSIVGHHLYKLLKNKQTGFK